MGPDTVVGQNSSRPPARVSIVLVAHSELLVRGIQDMARELAPDVRVVSAGGTEAGGMGISADLVADAIAEGAGVAGAVVLGDIGSATVLARRAVGELDPRTQKTITVVDAPFVEGAIAAAVAAQGGSGLPGVVMAAEAAGLIVSGSAPAGEVRSEEAITRSVTVNNRHGLHARPAAMIARRVADFDAAVTVDGVDAASVLAIMSLGVLAGQRVTLTAAGPEADDVLEALSVMVADGFGEM